MVLFYQMTLSRGMSHCILCVNVILSLTYPDLPFATVLLWAQKQKQSANPKFGRKIFMKGIAVFWHSEFGYKKKARILEHLIPQFQHFITIKICTSSDNIVGQKTLNYADDRLVSSSKDRFNLCAEKMNCCDFFLEVRLLHI